MINNSNYLGVYFILPLKHKKIKSSYRGCCDYVYDKDILYCSQCGKKLETIHMDIETKMSLFDIHDIIGNESFSMRIKNNKMVIFENTGYELSDAGESDAMICYINNDSIIDSIEEFKDEYFDEINKLEEVFCIEVNLEFGYIEYNW